MVNVTHCPVCDSELEQRAKSFMSAPMIEVDVSGVTMNMCSYVTYAQCPACHLFVQSPRMTDEHIDRYYREGHYRAWLNRPQEQLDADERRRAMIDSKVLKEILGDEFGDHLDVGSSRGYFLQEMNATVQVGVEAYVEYNLNAQADVYPNLGHIAQGFEPFDLVTALHVLEHTVDPLTVLADMASLCRKHLVIEVPSEQSPGGWGRLAHTYHFPKETLFTMANKIGMRITMVLNTPHTLVIMERKDA